MRHGLATTLTLVALLALAPLVWLVATVVAPTLLPPARSAPMRIEPVFARANAARAGTMGNDAWRPIPEPIATRWRTDTEGRRVLPMNLQSHSPMNHDPRRNAP